MTQPTNPISFEGLSVAERLVLIERIWDSLEQEQEAIELTQAQKDELDRRLADHEKNPHTVIGWEEIKVEVQNKIQAKS